MRMAEAYKLELSVIVLLPFIAKYVIENVKIC